MPLVDGASVSDIAIYAFMPLVLLLILIFMPNAVNCLVQLLILIFMSNAKY